MTPREPLPVTVVIPAYNREDMIRRALRSVAAQQPRPASEVIVVDDCSTDATGDVAGQMGARVVRHDVNRGEAEARNTGFAAAAHPWIALLDSDDEWLPHCLQTLWELRGDHLLVAGASVARDASGSHRLGGLVARRPVVLRTPRPLIYPENFIAASGSMVRRDAARAAGGYRPGLRQGADMDLWIRLLERGTAAVSPRVVTVYHVHAGQVTQDTRAMWHGHLAVAERYRGRPWWRARTLEHWTGARDWDEFRLSLSTGDSAAAMRKGLGLVLSPNRLVGAAGIVAWRYLGRRRASSFDANGNPTVSILASREWDERAQRVVAGRPVAHTGKMPRALRWLATARRPTAQAVVSSLPQALLARALGIEPIRVTRVPRPPRAPLT